MRHVTRGIAVALFAALLFFPRVASAGIIDFIWELSGPQFAGVPIYCFLDLQSTASDQKAGDYECRVSEIHLSGDRQFRYRRATPRFQLEIAGGVYLSTGKNSDLRDFEFGKAQLFTYEPMIHFRSYENRDSGTTITHGIMGLSYFFITGSDFKRFDNVGIKLMPLQVRYKRIGVGYTLRVFPNPFTPEQFGAPPGATTPTGTETVHGILVSLY